MFFNKHAQNLQNSYFNKLSLIYVKQIPVEFSPDGVLKPFNAGGDKRTCILKQTWKS